MTKHAPYSLLALICSLSLLACVGRTSSSILEAREQVAETPPTAHDHTTRTAESDHIHAVELMWKVPKAQKDGSLAQIEVDGFIIRYGHKAETLHERMVVTVEELKLFDHRVWGEVYSYLLYPEDHTLPLFYTLESFKGDQISPPSPLQEIKPALSR